MKNVILCGWNVGFNKVGLTLLLRERGHSLRQAKDLTDAVLDNKSVTVECGENDLRKFIMDLEALGVRFVEEENREHS